nr:MAG TPA: hypothetical protein [Bacteriophage sp.]
MRCKCRTLFRYNKSLLHFFQKKPLNALFKRMMHSADIEVV